MPQARNCGRTMIIGGGGAPITIERLGKAWISADRSFQPSLSKRARPAKHTHYTENATLMIGCEPLLRVFPSWRTLYRRFKPAIAVVHCYSFGTVLMIPSVDVGGLSVNCFTTMVVRHFS